MSAETDKYFIGLTSDTLKRQTVHGGFWTVGTQGARFFITMAATVVLARLLTPDDFGLLAMVSVIFDIAHLFKDLGLSSAAIQSPDLSRHEASNLFWLNVGVGLVLSLLMLAVSPWIAALYDDARAGVVSAGLSGIFLLGAVGAQSNALMVRNLRLKQSSLADLAGLVTGYAAAVILALQHPTYWVLVLQMLVTAGVTSLCRMIFCGWRPGRYHGGTSVGAYLRFGGWMTSSQFFNYAIRNLDNFLLGKYLGSAALGLYAKAYQLLLLPIQQITSPLTMVVLPALSRVQNDPERFRRWYLGGLRSTALVSIPVVTAMFVLSEPLILTMLGDQWTESVPVFRALLPAALVGATNVAAGWVFVALGRVREQFFWVLVSAAVTALCMMWGLRYGVLGMAAAVSGSMIALRIPALYYCYRGTRLRLRDFFRAVLHPLALGTAASIPTYGVLQGVGAWPAGIQLLAGLAVYGAAGVILAGAIPAIRREYIALYRLIRHREMPAHL